MDSRAIYMENHKKKGPAWGAYASKAYALLETRDAS